MTIEEALQDSSFSLERKDGKTELKENHVYWHQSQGHMFFTKRKKCFFIVWTSKDFVIVEIHWDNSWVEKVQQLRDFYLKYLLPKIIECEL